MILVLKYNIHLRLASLAPPRSRFKLAIYLERRGASLNEFYAIAVVKV